MGIEPTSEAWEASILPLNYARAASIVPVLEAAEQWAAESWARMRLERGWLSGD
jgi:hypothetical protein